MLDDAKALASAGIQMLVLECVPSALAKLISNSIEVPVIGIGAGPDTDGQVLVMHDMFGISANYMPKFSKNYLDHCNNLRDAVKLFIEEVKTGVFPGPEHSFE